MYRGDKGGDKEDQNHDQHNGKHRFGNTKVLKAFRPTSSPGARQFDEGSWLSTTPRWTVLLIIEYLMDTHTNSH